MTAASRFLFDRDFRAPPAPKPNPAAEAEAEARGFARGLEAGRREAVVQAEARLAALAAELAGHAARLLAGFEAKQAALENEALQLSMGLARKLAGEALAERPLAPIEQAAREAFQHLRGVPHLAVRVHCSLVEEATALVQRIGRAAGYEGRILVFGEPEIAPGDARLEWADGGVVCDLARTTAEIARSLDTI